VKAECKRLFGLYTNAYKGLSKTLNVREIMFSEREAKNSDRIDTLIGTQCTIIGNLIGDGTLKIDGTVKGDIFWQDDVILGSIGSYNGILTCKNATISGKVKGNVICDGTLTIDSSGRIQGDITAKNLVVKEGGALDGKSTMVITRDASEMLDS
jgi:cytoskeletal protein CcmA (bactofilin family)